MSNAAALPFSLVSLTTLFVHLSVAKDLIVFSRPSDVGEDGLYIRAKTRDLVVGFGDTVDLTCKTSIDWDLCGFTQPNGDRCNRLSESKYSTSCKNNERISYHVSRIFRELECRDRCVLTVSAFCFCVGKNFFRLHFLLLNWISKHNNKTKGFEI